MLPLTVPDEMAGPLRVLCLGAHCDDIEIGCAGTLLRLRESREVEIRFVVCCEAGRAAEARHSATRLLGSDRELVLHDFRDGFLPYAGARLKEAFEELKAFEPALVFTPGRDDRHQDHRTVSDLTWNTFRHAGILEYEIPKWDGDLGQPNGYVALEERHAAEKVAILLESYVSQRKRDWFDEETFRGLMRLRGVEARTRYAEAFFVRKLLLEPGLSRRARA